MERIIHFNKTSNSCFSQTVQSQKQRQQQLLYQQYLQVHKKK